MQSIIDDYITSKNNYCVKSKLLRLHLWVLITMTVMNIVHTHAALIREFPDWLVEMDIVRSPIVEEFLRHGIDERPTTTATAGSDDQERELHGVAGIDHREKKAPFNAQQHSYLYWPDARIPYAFHPYIGIIQPGSIIHPIQYIVSQATTHSQEGLM